MSTVDFTRAPFPLTHRELWLPRGINNNTTLPSSRYNGHELALTGARKGTTANMRFQQNVANSHINLGAIHHGATPWWISFRFKLHADHLAVAPAEYLICKNGAADFWIILVANDNLLLTNLPGIVQLGQRQNFYANIWYHVFYSLGQTIVGGAASDGRRLRVNLSIDTEATTGAIPGAGNLVIGDFIVGGGSGAGCVIEDIVIGTDIVTEAEEEDLYKGIPPADAVNFYPLDEGRGNTVYDRGSGVNNGTKGSVASWNFGQCKQPVLSLDGINDHAQSSAGVDITSAISVVWAGKWKSTYDGLLNDHYLWSLFIDNNTYYHLRYNLITGDFRFQATGGGEIAYADYEFHPAIDDYGIIICTQKDGHLQFFLNGILVATATWAGVMPGLAATVYIGAEDTPSMWDISKPLFMDVVDGAFTQKYALAYSRWLNEILHMGIAI